MQQWPCEPFGLTLSMHEKALGACRVRGDDDAWRQFRCWRTDAGGSGLRAFAPETRMARGFGELAQLLDALRQRNLSGKPVVRVP